MNNHTLHFGVMRPDIISGRSAVASKKKSFVPKIDDLSFMIGKHISKDLKDTIHERDDHRCHFCDFRAEKYQNIHHHDGDLSNHSEKNLVTICVFCHQCAYLDYVAKLESGMLIWLPEISQKALHHIARAIYVGRISQSDVAEASRTAYDTIMERRQAAVDRIGTDSPFIMASVLKDYLGPKAYLAASKKLDGIRLFPLDKRMVKEGDLSFNQFPQILAYWRSKKGPFGDKPPAQWIALTKGFLRKTD